MSDKYVPGSSVCEHGRLRRQCSDCEVTELYKEIGEKDALIKSQAKKLEVAVKALEEYTDDSQYCGRCDGMTYDTGNGEIARNALAEIKRLSGG